MESKAVKTREEARELHERVVEQTKGALYRWIVVIGLNLFTHFMRMAGSLSYMTAELGASELDSGVVITAHLTLVGLSNAYLSFSMDSHSFEAMITARFGLLTLLTLAEWLAPDFAFFAAAYVLASFAIVGTASGEGYYFHMLPASEAKIISTVGLLMVYAATTLGLALAGCVGGIISLNSIFLGSFIVSLLSLIYILSFVVGQESELKRMQKEEILPIYHAYPDLFPDQNTRFPVHWHDQRPVAEGADANTEDESGITVPFLIFMVFSGLRIAQATEFIAWWNVYCDQVFDRPITLPSMQMVVSIFVSIPVVLLVTHLADTPNMQMDGHLHWGALMYLIRGSALVLLYWCVFPAISFDWFWVAIPLTSVIGSTTDPFRIALQVSEYPVKKAGMVNALLLLSKTLIPAAQHIIIGALWNVGGAKHPWFFRWFAILHGITMVVFICYCFAKKTHLRSQYESIQ